MNRKTLTAAVLAAGALMGVASVAQAVPAVVANTGSYYPGTTVYPAQPNTTVYGYPNQAVIVQPAPPAPVYEAIPAPRQGYVWAPGHYEWRGGQYAWIPGEWMTARPGFAWRSGHWEQARNGSWEFVAGHWMRTDDFAYNDDRRGPYGDRDRDGVVNRDDRYPRDPSRY
ncbi:YXWGXW repeat-containing protein [Ramlibacter alkalitolerans]|uniref:YXWGXW repeat-containing protein n=1 Tax=Ramlibacter alkalitolerans TaxID=2039631 RepID=A0ABS1JNH1_9BURK|nr:YXWGXW repeat-containing protein [Ramlibacter alkalitolerans]MBL0425070.1 YXWGXW repeat-containing protein [Ramlibacter alkalitolerans]